MQKTGFSGKKQKKHHQRRKPRVNSASSVPKPKTTRDDSRSALSCCAQARGKRIPRRTFGKSRIQPFAGTARFAKAYLDFCASIFIVQYIFFSPFLSIGKERSKQIYFEKREKPEENSVSAVKPVADAEFVANAGKRNGNTGKFFSYMWSLLASFADVAGINGNSPSSLFTKEALGKGYIKFEPVNAFRLF